METKLALREVDSDRVEELVEEITTDVGSVEVHRESDDGAVPAVDPFTVVIAASGAITALDVVYERLTDAVADESVVKYAEPEQAARSYVADKTDTDPSRLTRLASEHDKTETVYRFAVPDGKVHSIRFSPVQTPPSEFDHQLREDTES